MTIPMLTTLHPNIKKAIDSWKKKPSLRTVYNAMYADILKRIPNNGRILEIGAGSGHSRESFHHQDVVRLDILPAPWVDIVADAHSNPFSDQCMDAIVMIDVLHHLADPPRFFIS